MKGIILLLLQAFYFMAPAYCANGAPVLAKDILHKLAAYPLDFNMKFRGKPIFGNHKTFRGLFVAVVFGIAAFAIQKGLYSIGVFRALSIIDYSQYSVLLGFMMGFGAITGDAIKSFFKRQFNHKPGTPWVPFDQLDFVIGALVFSAVIYVPPLPIIIMVFIVSPLVHITANHVGYWLRIREVKW